MQNILQMPKTAGFAPGLVQPFRKAFTADSQTLSPSSSHMVRLSEVSSHPRDPHHHHHLLLLLYLQASGLRKAPLGEGGMPTQTEMGFGYPGSTERVSSLKRQYLRREVGSR